MSIVSSRECQIEDWPSHQEECVQGHSSNKQSSNGANISYRRNDNSIFDEHEDKKPPEVKHPPLVDFSKASKKSDSSVKPDGKSYLCNNVYHTDVPEVLETEPRCTITVKCNKDKHKLCVQRTWTGASIYKFLACSLNVPLDKLKIIHKGKVLDRESIAATLADKAMYQVIGEQAEKEDGIDQRDIAIMMAQMGVDRNAAVKTLRQKGDLIDALLQ